MARPIKDNADYFTHDADMRNDPKIKALRRKFKCEGYGIWNMLLESITDSDNFRLDINYEIIAGDFDAEPDHVKEIIDYCIELDLFQTDDENRYLWSKTLDKRFEPLLSKRKRDRSVVIAGDNTQSKVKYSKEKKSTITQPVPVEIIAVEDWDKWGRQIANQNDPVWDQMRCRKVSQKEVDEFISVAIRNNWKLENQQSFRMALKGWESFSKKKSTVYTGVKV